MLEPGFKADRVREGLHARAGQQGVRAEGQHVVHQRVQEGAVVRAQAGLPPPHDGHGAGRAGGRRQW